MKIKVIPTGDSPDFYSFEGETLVAHKEPVSESFDLSAIQEGDKFLGLDCDTIELPPPQVIRDAYRDSSGELHVTICQKVGPGHWEAGEEFDSSEYSPENCHVTYRSDKKHAGSPWYLTNQGKVGV